MAFKLLLLVCFMPTVKANRKRNQWRKTQKTKKVRKEHESQKILPFLNNWSKMKSGATGECVSVEFLGGCGVTQPGVYGQSLPTDGNTRKRGPGPASELKRGHLLWEFPSLRVWAGSRERRGAPAGVIAGTKNAQNVCKEPCPRAHRDLGWSGGQRGGGFASHFCTSVAPSQATDRLQALIRTSRITMPCVNVGVAFFNWWCVGKGGYCTRLKSWSVPSASVLKLKMSSPPAKKHSNTSFMIFGGEERFVKEADMYQQRYLCYLKSWKTSPPLAPNHPEKSQIPHESQRDPFWPAQIRFRGLHTQTCRLRLNSSAAIVPLSLV